MTKGIILYDFFIVKGGAEGLTLALLKGMPGTDLTVAFKNDTIFPDKDVSFFNLYTLSKFTRIIGWQSIKSIWFFKRKTQFISQYDWVIYSGNNAPVAVINHHRGKNILYCHTPPRFVYDLKYHYFEEATWWQKPLLRLLILYVKYHYENSMAQMDTIIANSKNVQRRIKQYLGRDSIVIYPPIEVDRFIWIDQGDYYLSLSRIESYKRVGFIVKAFLQLPKKKLIVASGGRDLQKLQLLAKDAPNITFTGWCDEVRLQQLIGSCIATIYIPQDEDFGMSPVESMAAGKPVIGVAEGGLLETVVQGETGYLIGHGQEHLNQQSFTDTVNRMTPEKALSMRKACEKRAQLFRTELFITRMKKILSDCAAE
jgi:glycosyltransferase involved in cell wall biosynthesis